jgi:hypothetical protein
VENPRSRDLRRDQERRNDGWQAYQSENLIHRKHRLIPQANFENQKPASIRPLRKLLLADENLVCVDSPGHREQCQNRNDGKRFHACKFVSDCGQKCQSLAHFQDE